MLHPVLAMAIGIVIMMLLIIFTKMHAFPSLIISAIVIAVLAMPFGPEGSVVDTLTGCVSTVTKGFGNTMASIGVVIGFGCIMGIFLEKSGAAKRMALTILKLVGVKNCDVVLGLTGFVVSIPVFCDSGFVILSSLAKEFSRLTKRSMVGLGGILGMGLYITHFLVPPTPGPLAVISTFNEHGAAIDLGLYILAGVAFSVPLFIFSVFLFRYFGKKYPNLIVPYEIDRSKYTPEQLVVLDRIKEKQEKNNENDFITLYHITPRASVDGIFRFGFDREYLAKNANVYGRGVYTTLNTRDSRELIGPHYGDSMLQLRLIGGFDRFLIFDENLAKKHYGKNWEILNQLKSFLPVDTAHQLYNRHHLNPKGYANVAGQYGIRGTIYNWGSNSIRT